MLLAAVAMSASGCRGARVPQDELVVLIEAAPTTIDPRHVVSAYDAKLSRLVYAPLITFDDERSEPKMELAASVVAEGERAWAVTLREARFSDGRPVTAEDVRYTFDRILDPSGGSHLRQGLVEAGIEGIDVLDARRLRFRLEHPYAPFLSALGVGIMARPAVDEPSGRAPTGAGPFVFVGRSGQAWSFAANPRYFGGAPRARTLRFKIIRDDNARLLALVGGSGDLTQNTITPLLLDAVAAQPRLRVETGRSSVLSYLGMNCDDPVLRDVRVRRAIALAIDRRTLVANKLHGRAAPATGVLPIFHWAYEPGVERNEFDPVGARALLDEAGHPDPDGAGPLPRFSLVYKTSSSRFRIAIAYAVAAMLADVGIEVEVRPYEFATFFADVKAGNFQLFGLQLTEITEPDVYTNLFASTRVPTHERPDAGANRVRYRNPALDRLLEQGRRELDREARRAIYGEVQRVLARELPILPLWHDDNVVIMRREVVGYELVPTANLTALARAHK